jgi:hypothetical protein
MATHPVHLVTLRGRTGGASLQVSWVADVGEGPVPRVREAVERPPITGRQAVERLRVTSGPAVGNECSG